MIQQSRPTVPTQITMRPINGRAYKVMTRNN